MITRYYGGVGAMSPESEIECDVRGQVFNLEDKPTLWIRLGYLFLYFVVSYFFFAWRHKIMQTDMQCGLNIKHKTYSYSSETDGKKKV